MIFSLSSFYKFYCNSVIRTINTRNLCFIHVSFVWFWFELKKSNSIYFRSFWNRFRTLRIQRILQGHRKKNNNKKLCSFGNKQIFILFLDFVYFCCLIKVVQKLEGDRDKDQQWGRDEEKKTWKIKLPVLHGLIVSDTPLKCFFSSPSLSLLIVFFYFTFFFFTWRVCFLLNCLLFSEGVESTHNTIQQERNETNGWMEIEGI